MIAAMCLAVAMWQEARGEGTQGMLAVGDVVLNRSEADGYDICKVVAEPAQFTGWGGEEPSGVELKDALGLARSLMAGNWRGLTKGATYYHAAYVTPEWARRKVFVLKLGQHLFYRESTHARTVISLAVPQRIRRLARYVQ